jgi:RNA polymerase II subunit A-like phosphatase
MTTIIIMQNYWEEKDHAKHKEVKMSDCIANVRSQALQGCVLVFTGFFPLGFNPEREEGPNGWKTARLLGARCEFEISASVTHLIAHKEKRGSQKVRDARERRIPVVSMDWLDACMERWYKIDEEQFKLPR